MTASADAKTLRFGLWLLLVSAPAGLTLEALHALKVQVYLGSHMRRELWTLAHAHGNLLGILCLVMALVGERCCPDPRRRGRMLSALRAGALLMPLGFFLGGILNREGDPSLAVLLVPVGALCLIFAFLHAILGAARPGASA